MNPCPVEKPFFNVFAKFICKQLNVMRLKSLSVFFTLTIS
nr:MAG TPA: hypothetical protein [Caudoviricetes sp.]